MRSFVGNNGQRFELLQADLTQQTVDAIVNAANSSLEHGGGVAAAILRAGGPIIRTESRAWVRDHGPVEHAHPAYTRAGKMPCKWVIHAVGPIWGSQDEEAKLQKVMRGIFEVAEQLKAASLALPAISSGIYQVPVHLVACAIFAGVQRYFLENPQGAVRLVRLCLIDPATYQQFAGEFDRWQKEI